MHQTTKGQIEMGKSTWRFVCTALRSCGENMRITHGIRALTGNSNQHLHNPLGPKVNVHYLSHQSSPLILVLSESVSDRSKWGLRE